MKKAPLHPRKNLLTRVYQKKSAVHQQMVDASGPLALAAASG